MSAPAELDLQSPAMRPPPGVTPNLQDPTLHFAKERLLTMVLCLTFTAFFVLTRIYTKVWVIKSHGWEDCKSIVLAGWNESWLILDRYMCPGMGMYGGRTRIPALTESRSDKS